MNMRMGFLLLIGLPGSGKTTLSKTLVKNSGINSDKTYQFIHICYDELISFQNGNHESEWKTARNSVLDKIDKFVLALKNNNVDLCPTEFKNQFDSLSWNCDISIILDDNMYFKSMRYSLFQIARKHEIGFCQIYLNCSLENALVKNSLRPPETMVPPHVIENMHFKMEPPNLSNNWEKYSIKLDSFCDLNEVHKKIIPILNESLNNYFYKNDDSDSKELSAIQCKKSVLHQTDLALRKIISLKIKTISKNDKFKEFVRNLNSKKSEIFSDIKTGIISLPENVLEEINSDQLEKIELVNFLSGYF